MCVLAKRTRLCNKYVSPLYVNIYWNHHFTPLTRMAKIYISFTLLICVLRTELIFFDCVCELCLHEKRLFFLRKKTRIEPMLRPHIDVVPPPQQRPRRLCTIGPNGSERHRFSVQRIGFRYTLFQMIKANCDTNYNIINQFTHKIRDIQLACVYGRGQVGASHITLRHNDDRGAQLDTLTS